MPHKRSFLRNPREVDSEQLLPSFILCSHVSAESRRSRKGLTSFDSNCNRAHGKKSRR